MKELSDIFGTGELATALLEKLSNAVGWIATHDTPQRVALTTYIEGIKQGKDDPLTKAVLISNARKIIKEYSNQQDIVKIALQSMNADAEPAKVDEDWLLQFMDKARLVSSEEFQFIWGKILSNECNHPGCMPRALLETLPKMDREDAEAFTALKKITVQFEDGLSPVVLSKKLQQYEKWGITLDSVLNLQALGLVNASLDFLSNGFTIEPNTSNIVTYYGTSFEMLPQKALPIGNVFYTKIGDALARAIETTPAEGFLEEICIPFWSECNQKNPLFKDFEAQKMRYGFQ